MTYSSNEICNMPGITDIIHDYEGQLIYFDLVVQPLLSDIRASAPQRTILGTTAIVSWFVGDRRIDSIYCTECGDYYDHTCSCDWGRRHR